MSVPLIPERASLVMAHPDDEALWASSILSRVNRIIICFEDVCSNPKWSDGRRRSLAKYPLPNTIEFRLQESEVFNGASWPEPVETRYGLAVCRRTGASPFFSGTRYYENYLTLVSRLREALAGAACVVTHNPWGEYGHEEHVTVFRAVASLQPELGFSLWVTGYVSNKSYPLMLRHVSELDKNMVCMHTNADLGAHLKALYARNECWTWYGDYVWPAEEYFYRWLGPGEQSAPPRSGSFLIFNTLWIEWEPLRKESLLLRTLRRGVRLLRQ